MSVILVISLVVGLGVSIWVYLETGRPCSESQEEDEQPST